MNVDPTAEVTIPTSPAEIISLFQQVEGETRELKALIDIWETHKKDDSAWRADPNPYRILARRFFNLSNASMAIDVAKTATDWVSATDSTESNAPFPNDVSLHQTLGIALAHTGATSQAQQLAKKLYQHHQEQVVSDAVYRETLGLLARTYKDQAFATDDLSIRAEKLREALAFYQEIYSRNESFWGGVNVVFCHRLLNDEDDAIRIAKNVYENCKLDLASERNNNKSNPYWHHATLGEAAFVLGDGNAEGHYRDARKAVKNNLRHLVTTRRQLRRLIQHEINENRLPPFKLHLVDEWLPTGKVAMFVGHMIDQPGRESKRFTEEMVPGVNEAIGKWVNENKVFVGYASAACGSDILFHEQVRASETRQSRVVLPYTAKNFRTRSVSFAGPQWETRFDQTLDQCYRRITVSEHKITGDGIGYDYANMVLEGLAMTKAEDLDTEIKALAVWDGKKGDGDGGTWGTIQRWRKQGYNVEVINPTSPGQIQFLRGEPNGTPAAVPYQNRKIEIRAILFGDAAGFSKFTEEQVTAFVDHCVAKIADILEQDEYEPFVIHKRTTGDGFYFVFRDVRSAGKVALEICRFLTERCDCNWQDSVLPDKLNFRLALHAGPIHRCSEPFNGGKEYTGTHVSRAARLEPETPEGQVYASEAFAAICKQQRIKDFRCTYVKQLNWAKHYGTYPTFVITPPE